MWEFEFQGFMERAFTSRGATGVVLPHRGFGAERVRAPLHRQPEADGERRRGFVRHRRRCGYYAADITRSFPVNGKFSERQKQVYEAVLAGQEAAAALKPGARSCRSMRPAATR
jgi:Xaa-Pro aminopeptidase